MTNPIAKPSAIKEVNDRRLWNRRYRAKNRVKYREASKKWVAAHRDQYNASASRYRLKVKIKAMLLYGDPIQCVHCGVNNLDALCFDHINDDGAAHRKEKKLAGRNSGMGSRIYELIQKEGKIEGLQILCANCNMIKQLKKWRRERVKDSILLAEIEEMICRKLPFPTIGRRERTRLTHGTISLLEEGTAS